MRYEIIEVKEFGAITHYEVNKVWMLLTLPLKDPTGHTLRFVSIEDATQKIHRLIDIKKGPVRRSVRVIEAG